MQVVYELSRDPELLQQYYALREQCYRNELKLQGFDGSEDIEDRSGHILIARVGRRCMGGIRISPLLDEAEQLKLAGEHALTLPSLLPGMGFRQGNSCVWERLASEPSFRSPQHAQEFFAHLVKASSELHYDFAFTLSSMRNARFYKRCHSYAGVDYQIFRDIPVAADKAFKNLEHYLSVAHLYPAERKEISPPSTVAMRYSAPRKARLHMAA